MIFSQLFSKNSIPSLIRDLEEFDNHERVIDLAEDGSGLRGFIAIHSTKKGPALGGTRMLAYNSEDQALKDVLRLSRAMSYKCALANLPYGGGKGVIIVNNDLNRKEALKAYAKKVDNLRGLFKTGTDVGLTDKEVALMSNYTSHMLGVKQADRGNLNTANAAAHGVFFAMQAVLTELYNSNDFGGKTIAIKGIGKLGGDLAKLLIAADAKVYIADIDLNKCEKLRQQHASLQITSIDNIHKQPVDIYAPCALGNEFSDEIIEQLQCKAIVGGANNQLPSKHTGQLLFDKGILYAPDYIVNAGGLIYVADELERDGFRKERVMERLENIKLTLSDLFERSKRAQLPPHVVADEIGQERLKGTN